MAREWIPATVGCYWKSGDYYIGTYQQGSFAKPFPSSGYELTRNRNLIGRYPTLEAAKQAANAA